MGERCRCGAELLPHLHFCVGCGADRQAAPHSGPPSGPQPVTTLRGEPVPPMPAPVTGPGWGHPAPAWNAPAPAAWHAPAPAGWQPTGPQERQPAAPRSSPAPWLIALSVLVVLLLSASAALVTLRPELVGLGSEPVLTPAAAEPVVTPQAATAAPTLSPRDELAAQVDSDRARVEAVTGQWVPQLSSKKPGTVDSGTTYDDASILSHYRGLAAQYPGTALLWSGDWPVFKQSDYWVVISTQSFPTAAQANAWCDAQGFSRDDCLAKNLSHSGGPAGTTVPR